MTMEDKKIINNIVKELVCGIVSVEKDAYPRYYDHLDYRKDAEAFVVEAENGELYEVRVTNLKDVQTLNNIIKNEAESLWGDDEEEIETLETHGCDFCKEITNIEPAKSVSCDDKDKEQIQFLERAKKEKKFLCFTNDYVAIVDECPICGYKFTKEDYDNYKY